MLKLFQINVCSNIFSTGKIASEIGELAIDSGWDSYIAYGREFRPSRNIPIKIGNIFGQMLHVLENRIFDNHGLGLSSSLATKKLIREIEHINPDIIHIHNLAGYFVNVRLLLRYLSTRNTPIVWTLHSCFDFTGHCTHFDYEGCNKWQIECHNCPLTREYPQSWVFDRSRKNFRKKKELYNSLKNVTLVPVSNWLSEVVGKSIMGHFKRQVIYNGIDTDFFTPSNNQASLKRQFGFENKTVLLALASSWTPKKGVKDYLELADRLDDEYILVMVGFASRKADIPNSIYATPVISDRRILRDYYNLADVVLNLSYEETFGLTTVEGFACGTPSIVYDKTASPELVTPETGFVVDAGDIDGIVKCMEEIRAKGKSYYSESCRKRAVEKFDKNKNFQQYIDLYEELLKQTDL